MKFSVSSNIYSFQKIFSLQLLALLDHLLTLGGISIAISSVEQMQWKGNLPSEDPRGHNLRK